MPAPAPITAARAAVAIMVAARRRGFAGTGRNCCSGGTPTGAGKVGPGVGGVVRAGRAVGVPWAELSACPCAEPSAWPCAEPSV